MSTISNIQFNELGNSKACKKDLFDVTAGFVEEKPFSCAKIVYVFIDCLKEAGWITEKDTAWQETRDFASLVKLAKGPLDIYKKFNALGHKIVDFAREPAKKKCAQIIRAINDCISPIWDTIRLLTKVILHIPAQSVQLLKGISGGSLIFGMSWNAFDTVDAISQGKKVPENMIKLAGQVAYIALGVFTVLAVFFSIEIASVYLTSLSATTVVSTIGEYYQKHLKIFA